MEAKEILGLDVGTKQTGIARASNVARLAEPLQSVPTRKVTAYLTDYAEEHKLEAVVIGLPRNTVGVDTDQTEWVRHWATHALEKINLPFYWQDEALTSEAARNYKLRTKNSPDEHSLAATIILQDFLDGAETSREIV